MELIKLLAIFLLIILLLRLKLNLGISMTASAIVMGLVFGMDLYEITNIVIQSIISMTTIKTTLLLLIIMFLENIMRRKNLLLKIVESLRIIIGDYRIVMPILPAFLGLLPSAGGAMFSAPLVADVCEDDHITPERKSVINFWFRHIWECVLPLYPAVIITSEILKVDLLIFMKILFPFCLLTILLGLPYIYYGLRAPETDCRQRNKASLNNYISLIKGTAPILTILMLILLFKIDIIISLLFVVVALLIIYRYKWKDLANSLIEAFSLKIIMLVLGVMLFKNMLEGTGIVTQLPLIFSNMGIPTIAVVILLPFIVAFLTGMSQAYAAVAFPILVGLSPTLDLKLMALGFVSGFVGIMLSPMHLCLVLTTDYFNAKLEKVIVMMLLPLGVIMGCGYLYYSIF
ncbi:DUF401 family protein [Alkaliphilus peptidifermentans]|uniref:DUF401 family protein n=1 Tax=Alkaliphilus peptidifermentans DSM 18978 TaxID=1120976 RepID=A0A1G5J2M9_9FIRM|nr:DUF401 family protein [Alkaliphilus peptidifermentans]SCY82444.1 hypothetical protein SAMN03080606_02629 [Alkaliphilus peptidifermentans DSM 18978]